MPPLVRQLLLLPLLAPLLAVLLIGAFNPKPSVALRLLTWSTPTLPVGVWMMLAAGGGAGLSALGTGLALGGQPRLLQRQVRRRWDQENGRRGGDPEDLWPEPDDSPRRSDPPPGWGSTSAPQTAGPTRAAGESSPTVAVPYRVIRRGATSSSASPAAQPAGAPASATPPDAAAADDWNHPLSEVW